jgi:hypothetical protein
MILHRMIMSDEPISTIYDGQELVDQIRSSL